MPKMSKKARDIYNDIQFYKKCCHIKRPDNHVCIGTVQWEHPFAGGRNGIYRDIVVPVCSSMNYSPSAKSKAWSKLVAFEIYGIDKLKKLNYKKDWDAELKLAKSFFT